MRSAEPETPLASRLAVALLASLGVLGLLQVLGSLAPELVVRKDFVQDWLLGRTVLDGVPPYTMLPELFERYVPDGETFPQPSPHPPPNVLVMWIFGLLPLRLAAAAWLFFCATCLLVAGVVAARAVGARPNAARIALAAVCALAWFPLTEELVLGQITAPLVLLLTLGWVALRDGRGHLAGLFIGASIALKFLGWPLVAVLLLRRHFAAAMTACFTAGALNLATLPILGRDGLVEYYTATASLGSALYRGHAYNFSPYSIGYKVFEGTGSSALYGVHAPPFVDAPHLAAPVAVACLLLVVGSGVLLAARARSVDAAFATGLCISVVAGPIAWSPYLVALIPVAAVLHVAWRSGRVERPVIAGTGVALLLVPRSWLMAALEVTSEGPDFAPQVSAWVTLVGWLPLIGVLLLAAGVASVRPTGEPRASEGPP